MLENKIDKSQVSQPEKTLEQIWEGCTQQMLEECRRFGLEAISRLRAEGVLTDERLRRSHRSRRAIAIIEREQKRTPNR